jgi:hypothetical protein
MRRLLVSQQNELAGILYRLIIFAGLLFLLWVMPKSCSHKMFHSEKAPATEKVLIGTMNH